MGTSIDDQSCEDVDSSGGAFGVSEGNEMIGEGESFLEWNEIDTAAFEDGSGIFELDGMRVHGVETFDNVMAGAGQEASAGTIGDIAKAEIETSRLQLGLINGIIGFDEAAIDQPLDGLCR